MVHGERKTKKKVRKSCFLLFKVFQLLEGEEAFLNANLGHVRPTRADGTKAAARFLDGEEKSYAEADPEEPHECGAGLDLTAALLGIGGAEADPITGETLVSEVAAVDCL